MPNIPWRLIGYGVGALALIGLLLTINGWRVKAAERKAELAAICAVTREAAANPKLSCSQLKAQIRELGTSLKNVTDALNRQNAAVELLGKETARQQAEASEASQKAATRARAAEEVAERLRASARAGGLPSASQRQCEPSDELKRNWR